MRPMLMRRRKRGLMLVFFDKTKDESGKVEGRSSI